MYMCIIRTYVYYRERKREREIKRKRDHDNRGHFHCLRDTRCNTGFVFPPVYIIYLRSAHKS